MTMFRECTSQEARKEFPNHIPIQGFEVFSYCLTNLTPSCWLSTSAAKVRWWLREELFANVVDGGIRLGGGFIGDVMDTVEEGGAFQNKRGEVGGIDAAPALLGHLQQLERHR